ncbi:hypothetical protein [Mucilaginibacter sp. KACC 22063]|uniref:hypothetical protein n=1 Tax=Mucilaginibacter sp. KACC 22063 TaxID=3025666 RepID=UPI002365F55E|nr:hypothetical protein [Mucilaginibacter sp. KACC 22063]WDF56938.1 hypothetical protein PQ461_07705 [Mucilaginibacter sp. KACC 22063]
MKPKYLLIIVAFCVINFAAKSQTLSAINVKVTDFQVQLTTSKFIVGDVMISVDSKGRVRCDRYFDYTDTHAEYDETTDNEWEFEHTGRIGRTKVAYLDQADGFDNVGKVKSVGNVKITYYDRFDMDNQGKVKSIGNVTFTYYDRFDQDNKGKIKSIGDVKLTYYDRFDNDNAGKLKQIGNTQFAYYDRFDGNRKGMVKSIKGKTELLNIYYM